LYNGSGVAITPAPVQSTPGRFDGLGVGFYQVRVQSGDCAASSAIVEITEPAAALTFIPTVTNVTCNGESNGRVVIAASGGTGQIVYSISPRSDQFFTTGVFDNLAAGNYQIVIQDQAGCFELYDAVITQPAILFGTLIPGSIIPEICAGDMDGAFSITVAGGTAPYSVALDNSSGPYTQGAAGQTDFDFTGLAGGTHVVYILDAAGCSSELEVVMPDAVTINPIATVTYDCVNNAAANRVEVTYDASNDPADLDFDLDGLGNWQTSNIFLNVAPGSHFVNVRHTNGCEQATVPFVVDQVDPLTLVIDDGDLNQIRATAAGGGGQYEYSFNGEDFTTESTYAYYKSGVYTVIVRDQNGCTATASREFTYIDICIPNYFTPNGDGTLDEWAPGCTNNYPDLTFSIFDRYGRVIAKYRQGQKWNGKYNGEELPSGDYWYTLKLNNNKDDREFVGHFTLYR
jgi:gliding motility-associated-like protein